MASLRALLLAGLVAALGLTTSCADTETRTGPAGSARSPGNGRTDGAGARESSGTNARDDSGLDFSVETFDGATFSLAEQRGTPVVLNFWESW